MTEFFQTKMGHTFYEGTMPAIARELKRLNENLEKGRESQGPELRGEYDEDGNLVKIVVPEVRVVCKNTSDVKLRHNLSDKWLAIVLAGLRTLQREAEKDNGQRLPLGILDILKDSPDVLTDTPAFLKEIDQICEELND